MKGVGPIWIPFLPPSSNKIYVPTWVNGKPKGKRLSDEARMFKIRAKNVIQLEALTTILQLPEIVPYELRIAVFFEAIYNKGWPATTNNRYKRLDVTNRIKLIEDTVAEIVGIDDRNNCRLILEKHCDPNNVGLYVSLTEIEESEVGLTREAYNELRPTKPVGADRTLPQKGDTKSSSGHKTLRSHRPFRR